MEVFSVKKRFLAGLMAGALLVGGTASAFAELVVNVPTSKWASSDLPSGSVTEEAQEDIMGQIEDLLHDELVLTAEEARLVSGDSGPKFDLSGLSYEELVALKDCINLAIWESEEWQEVTVPQGVYEVGKDIPVGHWVISPVDGVYSDIKWGRALDPSGTQIEESMTGRSHYDYAIICSKTYKHYDEGEDKTELELQAVEGMFISIEDGDVVFTPYAGKPSLGFK